MSRKGNCWDKRFFGSLKREWTDGQLYRTRREAIDDVREYIASYYNSKRLHSTLGCTTPINYENILNNVRNRLTTTNPNNERIKRKYLIFLKEAKRQNESSIDAVAGVKSV